MASGEDSRLYDALSSKCQETAQNTDRLLSEMRDISKTVLLAVNGALYSFFETSANFKPKWSKDAPQLDLKSYEGQYFVKGESIPVFEVISSDAPKQILILTQNKLGALRQYSPLDSEDAPELKHDIFYMRVEAFSENPALMEEFVKKPPPWLTEKGNAEAQREYLAERALIRILERFEFVPSKDFEGYRITLAD